MEIFRKTMLRPQRQSEQFFTLSNCISVVRMSVKKFTYHMRSAWNCHKMLLRQKNHVHNIWGFAAIAVAAAAPATTTTTTTDNDNRKTSVAPHYLHMDPQTPRLFTENLSAQKHCMTRGKMNNVSIFNCKYFTHIEEPTTNIGEEEGSPTASSVSPFWKPLWAASSTRSMDARKEFLQSERFTNGLPNAWFNL